jgi:hypothetical protein
MNRLKEVLLKISKTPLNKISNKNRIPKVVGVIAQLEERYNGIVEVGGSIPPGSTRYIFNE